MSVSPLTPTHRRSGLFLLLLVLLLLVPALAWLRGSGPYTAHGPSQADAVAYDLGHVQRNVQTNAGGMRLSFMPVTSVQPGVHGLLRFGELRPDSPPTMDIVFLHGHAGRLDNHMALFGAWQHSGARVIALDWPSHGASQIGPLDIYTADDLIALVQRVERATLEDPQRPLVLAGWSYGGLIATRLAQQDAALQGLSRKLAGLVLLAPGVAVQPFVGGDGIARVETLMHAPYAALAGAPQPVSPLLNPVFAMRTLALAWQSRQVALPRDLPAQVIVADDADDWYVDTPGIVAWARQQQALGAPLQLAQCPGARHALDNEPWPLGASVQQLSLSFLQRLHGAKGAAPTLDAVAPEVHSACHTLAAALPVTAKAAP